MDMNFSKESFLLAANHYKGVSHQDLALTYNVATFLTVPSNAKYAIVQIEANILATVTDTTKVGRYWVDGSDPSLTSGIYIGIGSILDMYDFHNLKKWKFIRTDNTATVITLRIQYYG